MTEKTPKWKGLLDDAALPVGSMVSVASGRHDVLFVRTETGVFAYGNLCPHKMCPLSEGILKDGIITCKAHRWSFDAMTGAGVNPRGQALRVYPVRVADGRIEADLG